MMLVDSNVWIALFASKDEHHPKAETDISALALKKEKVVLIDLVISEVVTYLLRRESRAEIAKFLDFVLQSQDIVIYALSTEDIHEIMMDFKYSKGRLSFTDEALLYVSDANGYGLLTYDKELANRASGMTK